MLDLISKLFSKILGFIPSLIATRHKIQRDRAQDFFAFCEKRIANLEKMVLEAESGEDGAQVRSRLRQAREDLDRYFDAWQQKQDLAALVPPGAIVLDASKPAEAEGDQIRALADGSARLPPAVLGAGDYLIRGNAYYEAASYEQALEAFGRALDVLPDDAVLVYNRATTLSKLGRHSEALEGFNRALLLRPGFLEALINRAAILGRLERYEDAREAYDLILQVHPDLPEALTGRGAMLYKLGMADRALKDHDRALELRPDFPEALSNRSAALVRLDRCPEAVQDCTRALQLKPSYDLALYNRACAYCRMDRFGDALLDLNAAIAANESNCQLARADEDKDFEKLRNDPEYGPRFWEIVGREDNTEA